MEMLIAVGLLLAISSIVTSALMQMMNQQQTIWNRTEMHSGVRGATELLQQEVGQAGRIALPAGAALHAAFGRLPAACTLAIRRRMALTVGTRHVSRRGSIWYASRMPDSASRLYELLTVLDGDAQEAVPVASIKSWRNAAHNYRLLYQSARCRSRGHAAGRVRDRHRAAHRHPARVDGEHAEAVSATSTATARWCTSSTTANRRRRYGRFTQPVSQRHGVQRGEQARDSPIR